MPKPVSHPLLLAELHDKGRLQPAPEDQCAAEQDQEREEQAVSVSRRGQQACRDFCRAAVGETGACGLSPLPCRVHAQVCLSALPWSPHMFPFGLNTLPSGLEISSFSLSTLPFSLEMWLFGPLKLPTGLDALCSGPLKLPFWRQLL